MKAAEDKAGRPRIVDSDPWLAPYEDAVRWRRQRYLDQTAAITALHPTLSAFANGHKYFGIQATPAAFVYREWAPGADALYLIGDFNGWNRTSHPLQRLPHGAWEILLPKDQYAATFTHGSRVKVHVVTRAGAQDRLPLYARRVIQDAQTSDFAAQVWLPEAPFGWTDAGFLWPRDTAPLIYEAHVGMAQEAPRVGTYAEFAAQVLPRIAAGGYNAVQLMATAEHPYYGSFGYHVANFFAPSSRFGTPEELKGLIDRAHALGLAVFLDVVHSHAAKNRNEGIDGFDGTTHQFFHAGSRGEHPLWDSKLFDYGKLGVVHFLLSNLKYWLEEFHFDGFRFDGVTSMMYLHHGVGAAFDHYDKYFQTGVDVDGVTYLQLANALVREVKADAITVAEDVSGMPGIAREVADGGIGFDYRLAMGLPDYWFALVKTRRDEDWQPSEIFAALANRRAGEKHIAYLESHDQSLVGDQTMAFTLMGSAMYHHMGASDDHLGIDRGIALHKLLRLATLLLGGEGYLAFMGNEFGHPEWVDFPRAGNDWSFAHARRQWSLVDAPGLKYQCLAAFDRAMLQCVKDRNVLTAPAATPLLLRDDAKVLVAGRGSLVLAINFHPEASYNDLAFGCDGGPDYIPLLSTDDAAFGGHGRVDLAVRHAALPEARDGRSHTVRLYLPSRVGVVLYRPEARPQN